jgi:hypothetical protein
MKQIHLQPGLPLDQRCLLQVSRTNMKPFYRWASSVLGQAQALDERELPDERNCFAIQEPSKAQQSKMQALWDQSLRSRRKIPHSPQGSLPARVPHSGAAALLQGIRPNRAQVLSSKIPIDGRAFRRPVPARTSLNDPIPRRLDALRVALKEHSKNKG